MSGTIKHYLISGRVQGVGYRAFVRALAQELGFEGWVRNLQSGQVEALIAGSENTFEEFEMRLRQGPQGCQVTGIKSVILTEPMNLDQFEIMADGVEPWRKESFV